MPGAPPTYSTREAGDNAHAHYCAPPFIRRATPATPSATPSCCCCRRWRAASRGASAPRRRPRCRRPTCVALSTLACCARTTLSPGTPCRCWTGPLCCARCGSATCVSAARGIARAHGKLRIRGAVLVPRSARLPACGHSLERPCRCHCCCCCCFACRRQRAHETASSRRNSRAADAGKQCDGSSSGGTAQLPCSTIAVG